jgi:hypothetical protein
MEASMSRQFLAFSVVHLTGKLARLRLPDDVVRLELKLEGSETNTQSVNLSQIQILGL